MKQSFIIASKNEHKIQEMMQILHRFPFPICSMTAAGFHDDIEETGNSFEENAMIKARAIYNKTGGIVIADDSGLVVDALEGKPGIFSSRFAGKNASDDENITKLLEMMLHVPPEKRQARFICVIHVILDDALNFSVMGTCEGIIATMKKGTHGFGYDPIFYLPEHHRTMAELSSLEKNNISHRRQALHAMLEKLRILL